jgi:hypothetical protein
MPKKDAQCVIPVKRTSAWELLPEAKGSSSQVISSTEGQ